MIGKTSLSVFLGLIFCGYLPAQTQPVSQDPVAQLWARVADPVMDPSKVGTVEDVTLQRDVATLTLNQGQICLSRPLEAAGSHERVVAAVFEGSGDLRLAPTLRMERQQLAFHSKEPVLQAEFERAFFIFTDDTAQELKGQLKFVEGNSAQLERRYREWIKRLQRYGRDWTPRLLKGLLAGDPTRHAFFVAELKTRKHGALMLIFDSADPEEVELVRFDSGRYARDIWSKFPSGGRRPGEAFADPLAHHDYLLKNYVLDVTIEENTELSGQAKVELEIKLRGGAGCAPVARSQPSCLGSDQ